MLSLPQQSNISTIFSQQFSASLDELLKNHFRKQEEGQIAKVVICACRNYNDIQKVVNNGQLKPNSKKQFLNESKLMLKDQTIIIQNKLHDTIKQQVNDLLSVLGQNFAEEPSFKIPAHPLQCIETINHKYHGILTDFKKKMLENKQVINEWKGKTMQEKLKLQIMNLLKNFLKEDENSVQNFADHIVNNLNFEFDITVCQELNEAKFKRIRGLIQSFQLYKKLQICQKKDIELSEKELILQILSFSSFSDSIISNLIETFIQKPDYSFTNRDDLTNKQKENLVNVLWRNESKLKQYWKIKITENSLRRRKEADIEKIIQKCIKDASVPEGQIKNAKKYLKDLKISNFFDIPQVRTERKSIYEFIIQQCPNYLQALRNKDKCKIEQEMNLRLSLRQKLFQLKQKEYVPFEKWDTIEASLMEDKWQKIQSLGLSLEVKYQLRKWVQEKLLDYYKLCSRDKCQIKERIRAQIELFLIRKDLISLTFEEIQNLTEDYIQFPFNQLIKCHLNLTDKNIKDIIKEINNQVMLPDLKQYKQMRQIDIKESQSSAQIQILKIMYNLNYTKKIDLQYSIIKNAALEFIKNPELSTIAQIQDLTESYKTDLITKINESKIIEKYMKDYKLKRYIECQSRFTKLISQKQTNLEYSQLLINYFKIFGPIQKFDFSHSTQMNKKQLMDYLKTTQKKNIVEQIQNSQQGKEYFQKMFPVAVKIYKQETQKRLHYEIKKILNSMDQFEKKEQEFFQRLTKYKFNIEQMFKENYSDRKYEGIKGSIINSERFLILESINNAEASNKIYFAKVRFEETVADLVNKILLRRLNPEQRKEVTLLIVGQGLGSIKDYPKLTIQQKQDLVTNIEKSQHYIQFQKSHTRHNKKQVNMSKIPEIKIYENVKQSFVSNASYKSQQVMQEQQVIQSSEQKYQEDNDSNSIDKLLERFDKMAQEYKEKSNYKKVRQQQYSNNPSSLVKLLFDCHPWNQNDIDTQFSFWKDGTKLKRKALMNQLNQVLKKEDALKILQEYKDCVGINKENE